MKRELRTCPVTGAVVVLNERWPPSPPQTPEMEACWACGYAGHNIVQVGEIRAVPHPTPVLGVEGDVRPRREAPGIARDGVGAHELIFGGHSADDEALWHMALQRMGDLRQDSRLRGFSLGRRGRVEDHRVWNLLATPYDVAPTAATAWRDAELHARVRVIEEGGSAVAIAAFAPRVAFETWIVPAEGSKDFASSADSFAAVAGLAERVATRLATAIGNPIVNWSIHDGSPFRLVLRPELPATSPPLPSDLALVGVFPERAAKVLRGP